MIYHVTGDLFARIRDITTPVIIPHVCNNIGAWGSGFVVPLGRKYPKAKEAYLEYYNNNDLELGFAHHVVVDDNVLVSNMVAHISL